MLSKRRVKWRKGRVDQLPDTTVAPPPRYLWVTYGATGPTV